MIEMRWVKRDPDEGFERMPGITDSVGMVRILQYRVFRTHRMEGNHATELVDWAQEWSPWMDVPVAAE